MKKLIILAISAILVANVSAQEQKKECPESKQITKEERVELDIKRLSHELMLSDQQAEKFAATYRDYRNDLDKLLEKTEKKCEPGKQLTDKELDQLAKERFEGMKNLANLQSKYYDKFRKDLSARQVEKVLRLNEPFGCKPGNAKFEDKFGKRGGPNLEEFPRKGHSRDREMRGPEKKLK